MVGLRKGRVISWENGWVLMKACYMYCVSGCENRMGEMFCVRLCELKFSCLRHLGRGCLRGCVRGWSGVRG